MGGRADRRAGLPVPAPLGDFLMLRALRETGGTAVAITDDDLLAARADGPAGGHLGLPGGRGVLPAAARLRAAGWLSESDESWCSAPARA